MRLTQKIDRQSLHQAMRKASETEIAYRRVTARMSAEMKKIYDKGDERDLCELAMFLRYKPVFDDPKNGKPLSDAEFETECENVILAFVNDDREKIYGYLDKWLDFASKYNPPTEINNEADALKHYIYLRAQQSLGVTKIKEYPEYVATHFPDMTGMMHLQRVEQQLMIQSMWNEFLFLDNDVKIDAATMRALDANPEKQLSENRAARETFDAIRPAVTQRLPLADALIDAFDLDHPNPVDESAIKKFALTDWAKSLKGKNFAVGEVSSDELQNVTAALRAAFGSTETGYGLVREYTNCGQLDLDLYKTVFIDGISVFDMLPDPKNTDAAAAKVMDALVNQTGVVSIVQVAEINGKFEYKSDILDVRTGKNDNPDYVTKIAALEGSERFRKALFNAEKANLDNILIPGREKYERDLAEKRKADAQKAERKAPFANGKNDFVIKADEPSIAAAFKLIEDGRKPYNLIAEHLLSNKYVDKQGNEQTNPVADALSPSHLNVDTRDFIDLIVFARYAKTLGVGEKDLTDDETLKESVHMIMSFVAQDHAEIKRYLDMMFDFLESYTPPREITTEEDVFKTVLYMRVQQATRVKSLENPWYVEQRCPTLIDKADFSAFEAEYLVTHGELLAAWERDTYLNLGAGMDYEELVKRADSKREMEQSDPEDYAEMKMQQLETNQFHSFTYEYLSERRRRLAYADDFGDKNYTFKLTLPQSAYALSGDNPDPDAFDGCATALWVGCISVIYNSTYVDSDALRSYGFANNASSDAVHLIFVDGKSIYDLAKEANNGVYKQDIAVKTLLSALVNQSGLVQFARIMKDGDNLKMELDTVDFMHKGVTVNPEFVRKMTEYTANPDARYNQIKDSVVKVCNEKKAQVEAEERNKQYVAGEAEQWKDFAPDAEDLFAPSEYDKQLAAQARIEAYMLEQQEQLENLFNADLDLFEGEDIPVANDNQAQADEEEQFGAIKGIDFRTFKNGRYVVAKGNPNSAYSVATMGELRELGVYFGGITSQDDKAEYVEIDETAGYIPLDDDEKEHDYSTDLAGISGIKIDKNDLESVIAEFVLQNANSNHTSVDKTMFEKQYKLLFGDLYSTALHSINKECCKRGITISAEQMDDTFRLLDKVMSDSAKRVGYPKRVANGGYTPEQVKTMQEDFLDNYVPKNSVEQATRRLQANTQGYDFANDEWKKSMGYTALANAVTREQAKLNENVGHTPDNKLKVAQTYRAMLEQSRNRSFLSKMFNVFRYFREQNAIDAYKNQAMTKFAMGEREFNELCAVRENNNVQTAKDGVQTNYQKMLDRKGHNDLSSESSSFQIGGMSERESEQDLENMSVLSSNENEMKTRISVEEADHKRKDDDKKRKEDIKKEQKVVENNKLNQRK